MTGATNENGTVNFTYDTRGRVKTSTDVFGHLVEYAYDAASNRTQLKLDSAVHTTYNYDDVNRLTQLTDEASQNFTFGYDIVNRLTSKTLPNGVTMTFDYDGMSRLTRLKDATSTATLFDRQYQYNPANQIAQIAEPSQTRNFGYDNIDRLISMTNGTANENYSFDGVGNRTTSHLSATYNYQPFNRVTSTVTANYGYDANGNMTTRAEGKEFWRYNWDYENRLVSASTRKQTVRYKYDALGRRIQRIVGNGRENTKFVYDGQDVVMDDNSGTLTKYQNGLGIDNKLKLSSNGVSKYFIADHLGSTNALTDASGAILEQTAYDSFGNATNQLSTRYAFTGREFDNFTGLHYYRARFYDARLGRFISEDPIGFAGGDVNPYGYVGNGPLGAVDPSGLFPSQLLVYHHQNIIRRALPSLASDYEMEILAQEQHDFDANSQDEPYAPMHAMTRVGQSGEDARRLANLFIRNEICLARRLASQGYQEESLRRLSRAMHTLQDSTSPAHFDFQPAWNDSGIKSYWHHRDHYVSESLVLPSNADVARLQTRRAWYYYKGMLAMPDDFFVNHTYDSNRGPVDSISMTGNSSLGGGNCGCN